MMMGPFNQAWHVLKSYTSGPPNRGRIDPKAHMMQAADNSGIGFAQVMPRPKTFENRQFNVKNIGDDQELDPANFSTGDDMERRLTASLRTAQEGDPDDFDFRPKIDGMRVNENQNYPALSNNDMDPRLKYPYPKDANNPGNFAGGY